MNFLAHLYLSFDRPELLVGNLVADMLKGKARNQQSTSIHLGIQLHRAIDEFADNHVLVSNCVKILRPHQRKYAAVVLDILFDHILASNWSKYDERSLQQFSKETYAMLGMHLSEIPTQTASRVQSMIDHNWLPQYASVEGMSKTMRIMDTRSSFPSNFGDAMQHYKMHQAEIDKAFFEFFPELIAFAKGFILQSEV